MEQTEIQKRIEKAVTNGNGYHDSSYPIFGRFSDPLQANLKRMEQKNLSANEHPQRFLQWLSGRLALLDRAFAYHNGEIEMWKHSEREEKGYLFDNIRELYSSNRIEDIIKETIPLVKNYKNKINNRPILNIIIDADERSKLKNYNFYSGR